MRELAPAVQISYDPGTDPAAAAAALKQADIAIVFVLQHTHEAGDLETLTLPNGKTNSFKVWPRPILIRLLSSRAAIPS